MVGSGIVPTTSSERESTPLGTRFGEAGERIRSARIRSARSARSAASSTRPGRSGRSRPDSGMSLGDSYDEVTARFFFILTL